MFTTVSQHTRNTRRVSLTRNSQPHNSDSICENEANMKLAIFASLLAGAAAFAPVSQKASTTALSMAFENELGAQVPLGYWDPLGLVADGDQAKFDRLRYVEIKHGRIAMLAVAGYLVQEAGIRLPGDIDYSGLAFADVPNGFGALTTISGIGIAQIVLFIGFLELFVMKDITGGDFVGDFRNGALDFGWDTFDAETKLKKRAIELNQGRAAQMGILALMVHEQLGVSVLP
jgi:Chlorophyll A-B binding protein